MKSTQTPFHVSPALLRLQTAIHKARQISDTLRDLSRRHEDVCVSSVQEFERMAREREEERTS